MNDKYEITEKELERFGDYVEDDDNHTEEKYKDARGLAAKIRSHPLNRTIPSSKELISLATTEFKNREERKGLYDQSSLVSGWISGFLTERKPEWGKEAIKKALNQLECDIEMSISKHPERVVNGAFREDLFNAIQSLKGDVS